MPPSVWSLSFCPPFRPVSRGSLTTRILQNQWHHLILPAQTPMLPRMASISPSSLWSPHLLALQHQCLAANKEHMRRSQAYMHVRTSCFAAKCMATKLEALSSESKCSQYYKGHRLVPPPFPLPCLWTSVVELPWTEAMICSFLSLCYANLQQTLFLRILLGLIISRRAPASATWPLSSTPDQTLFCMASVLRILCALVAYA